MADFVVNGIKKALGCISEHQYEIIQSCQTTVCPITGGGCYFFVYYNGSVIHETHDGETRHWQNKIRTELFDKIEEHRMANNIYEYTIKVN